MTAALADLPDHYVKDRAAWRRGVGDRRDISKAARLYASRLVFRRWGAGSVSWARKDAAAVMGVSERTVTRWNRELREAGVLEIEEEGLPGRQQVFGLLSPLVNKGDNNVAPSRGGNYRAGVPGPPVVPGGASRPGTRPPDPQPVNRPLPGRKRFTDGRRSA